jgi:secreted trypsin-like serine protease
MRRVVGMAVVVLALVAGLVGAGPAGAQAAGSGDVGGDVVGGQPADPGEHPFQVAIVYDPAFFGGDPLLNQFCGGALIEPDVVLTAAHCAEEAIYAAQEGFPYVGVVAGVEDLDEATADDVVAIEGGTLYPGYWYFDGADLALLQLAEPIEGLDPIRLATPDDDDLFDAASPLTVLGWGDTSDDPNVPDYATTLQEGAVDAVDDTDCFEAYRQHARIELDMDRTLCAASPGVDACYGDSGGALVADDGGEPVHVGIVWNGIGCAEPLYPGLYVETARYAAQVEAVLEEPFTDIDMEHPFVWEISGIAGLGVAEGFSDGTFRPNVAVSRGAMAAYLYRLAGEPAFTPPATPSFPDVRTSHPFYAEVEWLADEGITTGYSNGTFRPGASVSRAAMAAYLYRFAGEPGPVLVDFFEDVGPEHPFAGEIGWAASEGIMQGSFLGEDEDSALFAFRPGAPTSRQAMAAFLARLHELVLTP